MSDCTRVIIASTIAVFCLLFLLAPAAAHGWYPLACCSDKDCVPLDNDRVKPEGIGGYIVDDRFRVSRAEVKDSPDGRYHGCFPTPEKMVCFFAPIQGS